MSVLLHNRKSSDNDELKDYEIYNKMYIEASWRDRWNSDGYKHVPVRYDPSTFEPIRYTQRDWNQTLTTKINQLSANIHRTFNNGGADTLILSEEAFSIIKDNDYFNSESMILGGRYNVITNSYLPPYVIIVAKSESFKEGCFNNKLMGVVMVDGIGNHPERPTTPTVTTSESKKRERRYLLIKK